MGETSTLDERIRELLTRTWGFDTLRPLQRQAVDGALAGRDALIVLPTGGGKSLCFQLPPLLDGRMTLVVSPLIALMKDQVDGLRLVGYPAAMLNSSQGNEEQREVMDRVRRGEVRLLYVSPERVLTGGMRALLTEADAGRGFARIAIDEAHCISAWGHDFRPEYRGLSQLRAVLPDAPIHALTATATPRVRQDILDQLRLRDPEVLIGTFDRPNLRYRILPKSDPIRQVADVLPANPRDAAIVYCLSRKETESLAGALTQLGLSARAYHAGMSASERHSVSEAFAEERLNVVVATIAFGMGIDRTNVRAVIHTSLPKSVEGYQQETGRAGRDGAPSECVLLYHQRDVIALKRLLGKGSTKESYHHQMMLLEEMRRFAQGIQCRHRFLSEYFGQPYQPPEGMQGCGACDVCLDERPLIPNATRTAHRILATVRDLATLRPEEPLGVGPLAAILAGDGADIPGDPVREPEWHSLRGWGCLRPTPTVEIASWVRQLADYGLLRSTGGRSPSYFLSPEGRQCLQARQDVPLRVSQEPLTPAAHKSRTDRPATFAEPVFDALRHWRSSQSSLRGVPAYVIMPDAVFVHLASVRPTTEKGLAGVPGLGEQRRIDFGADLLRVVAETSAGHGLATDLPVSTEPPPRRSLPVTATASEYDALFDAGTSMALVAALRGVQLATVGKRLVDWMDRRDPPTLEPWVSVARQQELTDVLEAHLGKTLTEVMHVLGPGATWEELHLVWHARRRQKPTPAEGGG